MMVIVSDKISELFFLDPGSINRWLQKYKEGGIDLLIADSYENSTKRSKLSLKEEKALSSHLSKNLYHKAKDIAVYIVNTLRFSC